MAEHIISVKSSKSSALALRIVESSVIGTRHIASTLDHVGEGGEAFSVEG
jgi:hypothetical protein